MEIVSFNDDNRNDSHNKNNIIDSSNFDDENKKNYINKRSCDKKIGTGILHLIIQLIFQI